MRPFPPLRRTPYTVPCQSLSFSCLPPSCVGGIPDARGRQKRRPDSQGWKPAPWKDMPADCHPAPLWTRVLVKLDLLHGISRIAND